MNTLGVNLPNFNMPAILHGVGLFALFMFFFVVIASAVGGVMYLRMNKKRFSIIIKTYREVNGQLAETVPEYDVAMITKIPNTTLYVFYLKRTKIHLPVGTRRMGVNKYYYAIRNNNEFVNFDLGSLEKVITEKGLQYESQDIRYGNTQLKRLFDSEYKSEKWWQTYRNEISVVVLIFFLVIGFFILIGQINKGILISNASTHTWNVITDKLSTIVSGLNNICKGSGVMHAGGG